MTFSTDGTPTYPQEPPYPQDSSGSEGVDERIDAAATAALGRIRAAAAARGLRPGSRPARRRGRTDATFSTARRDVRDPALLGDQIDAVTAEHGWATDVAAGSVMARWPAIAGLDVARHVTPVTFEDGVLTLRADSTAWATNLALMTAQLMARIDAEVGDGVVTQLQITGPASRSWRKGPRRAPGGRGPRDTYG